MISFNHFLPRSFHVGATLIECFIADFHTRIHVSHQKDPLFLSYAG